MKRARSEREERQRLGPAAAAMRRNKFTVFRDARESNDQLSADKLFQDAADMQRFHSSSGKGAQARLLIYSREELALYRQKTRAEMEVKVKRGYKFLGNWTKYARWEAQQKDFSRMRDVMQRAVHFHGDNPTLWRDFAELESANGFAQEARAVWSRGVNALPASTDLWLKYLVFEQAAASGTATSTYSSGSDHQSLQQQQPLVGSDDQQHQDTAASEATVRDVFNRWLAVPTGAPPIAYELYTLYEAQREQKAACQAVIRRYLEQYNSSDAWLFAAYTELNVFGDAERGVKVLQTALEALPDPLLWGPVECRLPLALAETLAAVGRVKEARQRFQELLSRVSGGGGDERTGALLSPVSDASAPTPPAPTSLGSLSAASTTTFALVDRVLAAYSRFERLHADAEGYAKLSRLEAQKVYERRLATHSTDFDAWLSLYLLLREAAASAEAPSGEEEDSSLEQPQKRYEQQALACLTNAVAAPVGPLEQNPYLAQQRAVLVMEYARACESAGQVERARQALEEGIRTFPFDCASCPRLWLEAAAFEERHGQLDTARTLLSAGAKKSREDFHVSMERDGEKSAPSPQRGSVFGNANSRLLFNAALRLEEHAMREGLCTAEEYLQRVRGSYQEAIRTTPLDERLWFGFAKLEEKEDQHARAHALYAACIRTVTAEACKTHSFAQRYALLAVVDKTWAKRLALQKKVIRKAKSAKSISNEQASEATATATAEGELRGLYAALLKGVWEDYTFEALAWRRAYLESAPPAAAATAVEPSVLGDGVGGHMATADGSEAVVFPAVPAALPENLGPARARWSDAVSAAVDFVVGTAKAQFASTAYSVHLQEQQQQQQRGRHLLPAGRERANTASQGVLSEEKRHYVDSILAMRAIFAAMVEEEKAVLKRTLGWDENTSYDAAQNLGQWVELLLSPLSKEWAAFEVAHGAAAVAAGASSSGLLSARPPPLHAGPIAVEPKRRTRLLRNRK